MSLTSISRNYDPSPRRFRIPLNDETHPNGRKVEYLYGCYFPQTDLCITEIACPGTGIPKNPEIEWIDPVDDLPWYSPPKKDINHGVPSIPE